MGYTTDFNGTFVLDKPLAPEHRAYLAAFADTRRMKRDAEKAAALPDPVREAAGLPIGPEAGYYVGGAADGNFGQDKDGSILNSNEAPGAVPYDTGDWVGSRKLRKTKIAAGECQPGLWCQWRPTEDGTGIEWDEGEKFYEYAAWLRYIIANFLKPWGYVLNGEVKWQGEEMDDRGLITVADNKVSTTALV